MLRMARQEKTETYLVLDDGRLVGEVIAPAGEPIPGPAAGTVLLRRSARPGGAAV
jgi:hypothetical protein